MEMIKVSIIGVFILMPFMLIFTVVQAQATMHRRLQDSYEHAIEEAAYDSAYILKTYSQSAYDSRHPYNIDIPYNVVIDTFYEHLDFVGMDYSYSDFVGILFLEYDGVRLYSPQSDTWSDKTFYCRKEEEDYIYYTLGNEAYIYEYSLNEIYNYDDLSKRNETVYETLRSLVGDQVALPDAYKLSDDSFGLDLGIIVFYEGTSREAFQIESFACIAPAGIVKREITY